MTARSLALARSQLAFWPRSLASVDESQGREIALDAVDLAVSVSAIVLAAGEGTRMRSDRPKPLHMICGRAMVLHVIDALQRPAAVDDRSSWSATTPSR